MSAFLLAGYMPPVSVVYVPDPKAPMVGWKCPTDRQFIAHTNPARHLDSGRSESGSLDQRGPATENRLGNFA
jgi:hypothetical protein